MLLHGPKGGIRPEKAVLLARFQRGEWAPLPDETLSQPLPQDPQLREPDAKAPARRATHLAHLDKLSAARQALSADPLAPPKTRSRHYPMLTGAPPPQPYTPLHPDLAAWEPPVPLRSLPTFAVRTKELPQDSLATRRKYAEIVRAVLYDAEASQTLLSPPSLPVPASLPALGLRRVVALRKPNGGTRGLMIGDFLRRLVARTLAQQFAGPIAEACHPHQYPLGSRVGAEALIHEVQARFSADP